MRKVSNPLPRLQKRDIIRNAGINVSIQKNSCSFFLADLICLIFFDARYLVLMVHEKKKNRDVTGDGQLCDTGSV